MMLMTMPLLATLVILLAYPQYSYTVYINDLFTKRESFFTTVPLGFQACSPPAPAFVGPGDGGMWSGSIQRLLLASPPWTLQAYRIMFLHPLSHCSHPTLAFVCSSSVEEAMAQSSSRRSSSSLHVSMVVMGRAWSITRGTQNEWKATSQCGSTCSR